MKLAIISGASGDLGRVVAARLARDGYTAILLYKNASPGRVRAVTELLPGTGHRAMQCDVTDGPAVRLAIENIEREFGRIDVCIHAASSRIVRKSLTDITEDEFRGEFEVAVNGGFNLFQPVSNIMKRQRSGALIGI